MARLLVQRVTSLARSRDAVPVFVYLKQDVRVNPNEEKWRRLLAEELEAQRVTFIDLMSHFLSLPDDELTALYHPRWYHYTSEANARVADLILEQLPH